MEDIKGKSECTSKTWRNTWHCMDRKGMRDDQIFAGGFLPGTTRFKGYRFVWEGLQSYFPGALLGSMPLAFSVPLGKECHVFVTSICASAKPSSYHWRVLKEDRTQNAIIKYFLLVPSLLVHIIQWSLRTPTFMNKNCIISDSSAHLS